MTAPVLDDVLAELAELRDPTFLAVNTRHGDDHAVHLTALRAVAKKFKAQPDLATALWATDDSAARLLAILVCRPKQFRRDELDTMIRQTRTPKVHDWLVGYVVKKSPHAEELRVAWLADADPVVASAGCALTADRVVRAAKADDLASLDLDGLLDVIEAEMADAPERLQWAMNTCLAHIGIEDPGRRPRALAIGERLGVLRDYPTAPNCTSPYAPTWITEMVRRRQS